MKTSFKIALSNALIGCFLFLSGCGPSTYITGAWVNPEAGPTNYDNILVAAMTENISVKQTLESELAQQLRAQGINATKSIEEWPPSFTQEQPSKEAMMQAIQETGHDAVLTVAIVDEETETRYVPGAGPYAPMARYPYYGNFWGYYNYWYPQFYEPGYYTQDKIYFLETNLYDIQTERLVWSAQSETVNPGNLQNFAEEYAQVTVDEMTEDNLLGTGTASLK